MTDDEKLKQSIEDALRWAFGVEYAQLDLPNLEDGMTGSIPRSAPYGMEWVLMQRAQLGDVQIDGQGYKPDLTHEDAEAISASVSNIPRELGGGAMAVFVSELARTNRRPDVMAGVVPKVEPVEWKRENGRGPLAKSQVIRVHTIVKKVPHPRNPETQITRRSKFEERITPIRWSPTYQEIESRRATYSNWRAALGFVRDNLGELRTREISPRLPPARPWEDSEGFQETRRAETR